jgi:prevent-host-death family protein
MEGMTIYVNIGEAKARFSELVNAAVRGEEVIIAKAGVPTIKWVPLKEASDAEKVRISERRKAAFGMYKKEFEGFDLSSEALKSERGDPEERFERKFGSAA